MFFENLPFDVPSRLTTDAFILRPITAADAERDHEAVIDSRVSLRTWEQSPWPEDDFTVAANRADLQNLEQRHALHQAFTYTMLDPTEKECLGCVYIMPLDARMFDGALIVPLGTEQWGDYDAAVYFWVREPRPSQGLDSGLLDALRHWLGTQWRFRGHLFVTSTAFAQQMGMIEATDLRPVFEVHETGKSAPYRAYAE